jgi:signal transduction histidine kinase
MFRTFLTVAVAAAALALAPVASAQPGKFGSAAEARAMLDRAVAALKANEAQAIGRFNKSDGGFRDRDLYPFCFLINDGRVVAHVAPVELGRDVRTIKDAAGNAFGLDLFNAAKEGRVTEVSYMFPRPGSQKPEAKVSFVTRVGNVGCGVGYYK